MFSDWGGARLAGARVLSNHPTSIVVHGLALNITVSIWNYSQPWSTDAWARYWLITANQRIRANLRADALRAALASGDEGPAIVVLHGSNAYSADYLTGITQRWPKVAADYVLKQGAYNIDYVVNMVGRLLKNREICTLVVSADADKRNQIGRWLAGQNLQVLEVAREVFLEHGIRATTQEVARRAGVAAAPAVRATGRSCPSWTPARCPTPSATRRSSARSMPSGRAAGWSSSRRTTRSRCCASRFSNSAFFAVNSSSVSRPPSRSSPSFFSCSIGSCWGAFGASDGSP